MNGVPARFQRSVEIFWRERNEARTTRCRSPDAAGLAAFAMRLGPLEGGLNRLVTITPSAVDVPGPR